jgi:hypothetical protein
MYDRRIGKRQVAANYFPSIVSDHFVCRRIRYDRGSALLMLMLMTVLIVSLALLSLINPQAKKVELEQRTHESLSRAKEALIAYAITRYDQDPGVFVQWPCVDNGSRPEGEQAVNCGTNNANIVGKLPWKELDISPLKDSSGECLWLAISGHYKNNNTAMLLNEDSPGLLRLYASDGVTELTPNTSQGRLVAVIIAPGLALPGQNRNNDPTKECRGDYNAAAFLEAVGVADNANFDNATTPYSTDEIAQGDENSRAVINDRIITISRDEIWSAIQSRNYPNLAAGGNSLYPADIFTEFTRQLTLCMANYGRIRGGNDSRLPWTVPVNLVAPSVQRYSHQNNYEDQTNTYGGRFPYMLTDTSTALGGANTIFNASAGVGLDPCSPFRNDTIYRNLWNHWKDHIFYAVSAAFAPNAAVPAPPATPITCLPLGPGRDCLSVNGGGDYAAIVMFAGSPLPALGQFRDAPPELIDNKALTINYLEGGNDVVLDTEDGSSDYQDIAGPPGPNFNDILFCINQDLSVAECL